MTQVTQAGLAEPLDEPGLLAQSRRLGRLRFPPSIEADFKTYMHRKMCSRVWPVAVSSIGFMLLFIWVDYAFLPASVYHLSITVRVLILLLVCFCLWYSNRPGRVVPRAAFNTATLGYVSTGLMVIMVILICRVQQVPVPVTHDGLYLILLSGCFLLGLPMRSSVLGSWFIVLGYLAGEMLIGSSRQIVLGNGLFLGCFILMGSIGAYAYEHMLRRAYLNEQLLQAARDRAERESQGKTRFLATASHDLRQPLHAMTLFIRHLEEKVIEPETRKSVNRLAESTHLLQAMLNSLLDISRLSVGMVRPQLRHINLHGWLQRLLAGFEVSARERDIDLTLDCPARCALYTDPMLLERLVRNYLNNALVHAGATRVQVVVSERDEQVRIAVVDNGCGLSRDEQRRIFEEFTQLHNPARTLEKGVGLGLSICRQLQHLLEYPSGVESEPGQGACFWIEVPKGEWQEEAQANALPSGAMLQGRVLLVENDLVNRQAMETLLCHWGCEVECHEQGGRLLRGDRRDSDVNLLLADFHLEGELTGLELIEALRQADIYTGPAVLVTADTNNDLALTAEAAGVLLIYKPVLPARLRRLVQSLLQKGKAESVT
ncbi:ATP-binding protein [Halopseudomonas bauzanensis]|uniref:ATP-binding protein n=1 Tax=Halopseudomonas bauzanensis TaxID=653930 RepID=UPI003523AD1E